MVLRGEAPFILEGSTYLKASSRHTLIHSVPFLHISLLRVLRWKGSHELRMLQVTASWPADASVDPESMLMTHSRRHLWKITLYLPLCWASFASGFGFVFQLLLNSEPPVCSCARACDLIDIAVWVLTNILLTSVGCLCLSVFCQNRFFL